MCNRFLFGLLLALTAPVAVAKTALDLMLEGRFGEAKTILDTSNVSPRYQLLYFAMVESDAARACSLYQVIAVRYPNSDCDSVARLRLDQAQEAGFVLVPIAEWAHAAPGAHPFVLRREPPRGSEVAVSVSEAAALPPPPAPVAAPIVTVPVSVETPPPPPAEEETQISVRDTLITAKKAPEVVKPVVEAVVVSPPTREIVSTPVEAEEEPVARETAVTPSPAREQAPMAEPPPASPPAVVEAKEPAVEPPPAAPVVEKVTPPPVVEAKEPVVEPQPAAPVVEKVSPPPVAEAKETVVEPPPAPAAAVVESPPTPVSQYRPASNGSWYIQVGAFGNFDNAHRLALSLQTAGYPVKLVPRDSAKGKLLQVRVGGYATRDELEPIGEQLKEKFRVPTFFVSE